MGKLNINFFFVNYVVNAYSVRQIAVIKIMPLLCQQTTKKRVTSLEVTLSQVVPPGIEPGTQG